MIPVSEVMTRGVYTAAPEDTLASAARTMREADVGVLPVCEDRHLVGIVTDRDIAVRAVAERLSPDDGMLGDIMTEQVRWCYEDASVEEALETMNDAQVRRLPVVDHQRHVVGLVSLADAAIGSAMHER